MDKQWIVHIVPSTHWDREWYITQRRFQFRLIRVLDKVQSLLKDDRYRNFLLDGQTIPLEDYLEINPHKRDSLKKLVFEDKITVGPWYVVPDSLIPSGESLIKNLQLGYQTLTGLGGINSVGYCPDSFGLNSQLPQLFSQFGYKYAQFTRGERLTSSGYRGEIRWQSPDGSHLLALFDGYASGFMLSYESCWRNMNIQRVEAERVASEVDSLLRRQRESGAFIAKNRLMVVGIDHMEPQDNLDNVIDGLNQMLPDMHFIHSTQTDFFNSLNEELNVLDLPLADGEQCGPYSEHFLLSNTLSSRMDIKLQNRLAENTLERYAAPLNIFTEGLHYAKDFNTQGILETAWKELVKSHAHDSICACSADDVMADVATRLRAARDMGNDIVTLKLKKLAANISPSSICPAAIVLFNPLPFKADSYIDQIVRVPYDLDGTVFSLCTPDGMPVTGAKAELVCKKRHDIETDKVTDAVAMTDTTRIALPESEKRDMLSFVRIRFYARELPPCGYSTYYLKNSDVIFQSSNDNFRFDLNGCENPIIKLSFNRNGSFDLLEKQTGILYPNQNHIEDMEDQGDAYTYSPGQPSEFSAAADISINDYTNDYVEYRVVSSCSPSNGGDVKLSSIIRVFHDSDTVHINTGIQNSACNHRVRACFTLPDVAEKSVSDTAFDLVSRPVIDTADRTEKSILTQPMRNLLYIEGNKNSLLLLSKGPQEYECINDTLAGKSVACMTLLRSVESVYRTVTLTKDESGCGAGDRWWTEDAKMIGNFSFAYAVKPCSHLDKAVISRFSDELQYPPIAASEYSEGQLPSSGSFLQVKGVALSLVDHTDQGLLVRVWNVENFDHDCVICPGFVFSEARLIDLAGNIMETLYPQNNQIVFTAEHNKIYSVLFVNGTD